MHRFIIISTLYLLTPVLSAQVLEQDSLALVELYHATDGDNWTDNSNWLNGPVSTWYGITLGGNRVLRLELYGNNLTGHIPAEIGDLTAMERIDLSSNFLSGEIPETIGNCTALTNFDVTVNMLTGTIPMSLSACQDLADVVAYRNEFSGPFPEVFLHMPDLVRIDIGSNQFSGPIPAAIDTLSKLRNFAIDRNDFTGPFPSIKNMTALVEVHLRENEFEGLMDTILGYHPNLYYFTFSDNNFSGCLTETHFNPSKLEYLHLNGNAFDCMGDFSAFADTGVLRRIWCGNNQLPFEDLEPNRHVGIFEYSPQDSLLAPETYELKAGDTMEIQSGTDGLYTTYSWYKNGNVIPGEISPTLRIESFEEEDAGAYHCAASNDSLPSLTLFRHVVHVRADMSSAVDDLEAQPLHIFPNPADGEIFFSGVNGNGIVEIYAIEGRHIRREMHTLEEPYSAESLAPGLYMVRVLTEERVYSGLLLRLDQ